MSEQPQWESSKKPQIRPYILEIHHAELLQEKNYKDEVRPNHMRHILNSPFHRDERISRPGNDEDPKFCGVCLQHTMRIFRIGDLRVHRFSSLKKITVSLVTKMSTLGLEFLVLVLLRFASSHCEL